MPTTTVVQILSGTDLVPHVEMGAYKFAMRRFTMPGRVLTLTDMRGWNVRKISDYKKVRTAQALDEATDIPTSQVARKRLTEISPLEWGDRYPITDRRMNTDPEAILADTIEFLGYSLGSNKEQLLMAVATEDGPLTLDGVGSDFSVQMPIKLQHEFRHRFGATDGTQPLWCVIHPFQAQAVMEQLITFSGATAQAALAYRDQAIRGWTVPGFDNMNIAISDWVPRKVLSQVAVTGSSGTFRLEINTKKEVGVDITADITYSATPATTASNIAAALNALTGQSGWTADGTGGNADIEVQSPIYLDAESELRPAFDLAGDSYDSGIATVVSEKGAVARAPVFQRSALVHDVREPIRGFQELVNQGRTLEISAYETFGVDKWRDDRIMLIETDANSNFVVA